MTYRMTIFPVLFIILFFTKHIFADTCSDSGRQGECVLLRDCPTLNRLARRASLPTPDDLKQLLRHQHCGRENNRHKVCCIEPPPDVSQHPNVGLLPQRCGIQDFSDKVIGGNVTQLFEFPWMAILAYNTKKGRMFQCGGTVISARHVLTAAHCVTELDPGVTLTGVRVGEHDLSTTTDCQGPANDRECAPAAQDFPVQSAVAHEDYSSASLANDIAIIQLQGTIDLTKFHVQPICLPVTEFQRDYIMEGSLGVITGWGLTELHTRSSVLLKASLPIFFNDDCAELYNATVPGGIGFKKMCAGAQAGVDACTGDSGGPLQALAPVHKLKYAVLQLGVVSFGLKGCGTEGRPSVYTRVAYYMDWILDHMTP